ncbi:hypothetical protein [Hymenobacter crusticola]|uniref:Uncharacterized protein n=1 Tax=Hymenobacter crusticola TaxID=1770526 RepID=A0A243WCA7_9BACT|nr:hypothetical protein [Hymenobacter crusticola]OUJ73076.1 hypothetical protein BXP70_14645 [Hymenobacter crusticola]
MRPELERLQRIEDHLLHQPAADWYVQELVDADLAADTDLQRQLYQGLYVAGQQQLRRELAVIHQQLYGTKRPSRIAQCKALLSALRYQLRCYFFLAKR